MPNIAAKTPPVRNMPTQPVGEVRKRRTNPIGLVVPNAGDGATVSRIGAKAIETSTLGTMNSTKPDGSPKTRMYWAETTPSHLHDHVERQQHPARLVRGLVIQPAFGGDVDAAEAEPDEHPQQRSTPRGRSWSG